MEIWIDRIETVHIIPNLVDTDPFHGGGLALPVRRAARRDAGPPESQMAGKLRNAAGGAIGGPFGWA